MLPSCTPIDMRAPPAGCQAQDGDARTCESRGAGMSGLDSTLAGTGDPGERPDEHRPYLCLALESHRPAKPPVRIGLAGIDEVVLGRGAARRIERTGDGRLAVRLDDPRMSVAHAHLTHALGRWGIL